MSATYTRALSSRPARSSVADHLNLAVVLALGAGVPSSPLFASYRTVLRRGAVDAGRIDSGGLSSRQMAWTATAAL